MVSIVNTHRGTKARNSRYRYLPTLLALIAVVTWASVLIAWMQSSLEHPQAASQQQPQQQQQQQQEKQRVVDRGLPAREIELFPDDLQHQAFFATLKSCLPADKKSCKQFIPDSGIERIGILSPPGALGFVFESFVDVVMRLHPSNHSMEIVVKLLHHNRWFEHLMHVHHNILDFQLVLSSRASLPCLYSRSLTCCYSSDLVGFLVDLVALVSVARMSFFVVLVYFL